MSEGPELSIQLREQVRASVGVVALRRMQRSTKLQTRIG